MKYFTPLTPCCVNGAQEVLHDCERERADMPEKSIYYISGPMTGKPDHNFPLFHEVEAALRQNGDDVRNPANHFDGDTSLEWETYMRKDVEELFECTHMILLPGWQNSRGARIEYGIAQALGLVIETWGDAVRDEPPEMQATQLVRNGERQSVYGHPAIDFERTAKIWSGIIDVDLKPEQVALMMMGLKMSRLVSSPGHPDSIVDAIGYAVCYDRVIKYGRGDSEA